ncbi:MAG: NAD(P)-binding protein [Lachnospiraceae bacterium]|nr:NAD(P)-binding protein [Lachnospiraceae bacterium]
MSNYDHIIVGAGLFGAVCAHELTAAGKKCLVLDRRDHIGGNIYTKEEHGINVHEYGAHIFHTSDRAVWEYICRFAEFNNFVNSPVARYKDELYNLPFNMNTFSKMWGIVTPDEARSKIDEQIRQLNISEPKNLEEQALSMVGRDVYEKLVKGYTEKQWGRDCRELPAFIIKRLPLRFTYDNNYFNDRYQGIPQGGYTTIIEKMLEGCEVRLGVDFLNSYEEILFTEDSAFTREGRLNIGDDHKGETGSLNHGKTADKPDEAGKAGRLAECLRKHPELPHIIYTGSIDEFFDYSLGALEYRSLRFEKEYLPDTDNYQGCAVVNYTEREVPFTRIIEHKHFEFGKQSGTVITREYPAAWHKGDEPYYPVNNEQNAALYARYQALAAQLPNVTFGGRLGLYRYYDMDKTVMAALETVKALEKP